MIWVSSLVEILLHNEVLAFIYSEPDYCNRKLKLIVKRRCFSDFQSSKLLGLTFFEIVFLILSLKAFTKWQLVRKEGKTLGDKDVFF